MFSNFFNNKTTIITISIAGLLILFFLFSLSIVLIQEKLEDTVYTTKERLRKSAVLLIGSTVNVTIAWFIYFWIIKPRLDNIFEEESPSYNENYDNVPIVETSVVNNEFNDTPAFVKPNENFEETIFEDDGGANEEANDYTD